MDKRFEDVVKCKDVAEFNRFVDEYLEECVLEEGVLFDFDSRRIFLALFDAWKESCFAE